MPEEQELKLTVTLDDQASAQLGQLQQTLQGLGNIQGSTSGMNNFAAGLRNAGQHAGALHGSLTGMAARGGFIGGFFFEIGRQVHQMADEFVKAVLDIKKYSDEMVRLDQNAQRAATSMAQFRANVAVFRESGLAAGEAERMLKGYASALANLQRPGSTLRQELLAGAHGEGANELKELLRTVEVSSQEQGIEAIRAHGRRIRELRESQGQPERGAQAEATFYARLGMPGLEKVRGQLREVTAAEKQMYKDRDVDTKRFQTALEKQADSGDRIVKSLQSVAFQVLPINAASELLSEWWEKIAKSAEEYDRNLRRAKTTMESAAPGVPWWAGLDPRNIFQGGPYGEALRRREEAGRIVMNPPPVDVAPGGRFRGGGTYGGGGLYGSDIEPGIAGTPLPGEKPISREEIEQARYEQALKPNRNPALRRGTSAVPGTPGYYRRTHFMGGGDGGGEGLGESAAASSDLQRAYEANIGQIDSLSEEFRRLNFFFQMAELTGFKPGDILTGGGRGKGPGTGPSGSPDSTSQSSPTDQTSTTASGATPPGHEEPLPAQVPWPEPGAGIVIPPGFGAEPGTGGGVGGGGPTPFAGTVAPGAGGAFEGKPVEVPPGWGPGGGGQGWGTTPGGGAAQYPPGAAPPDAGGGTTAPAGPGGGPGGDAGQAAFLRQHRAKIMEELKDPHKRNRFMGLVQAEVGNDPAAQKAFAEATIDRWAARGQNVERGINSRYYGGNPRFRTPSETTRSQMPNILQGIEQGSASYPGATGNASAGVARSHAAAGRVAGLVGKEREAIIYEENANDRRFRENVQRARSGQQAATAPPAAAAPPAAGTTAAPPTSAPGPPPAATTAAPPAGAVSNPGGGTPGTPGANVTDAGVDRMLRMAGYSEHNPQQRAILKQYLKGAGGNIDPKYTPWCASIVNASLAEEGRKGTGSLAASSFLNWGAGVKEGVKKGDVLVTHGRQRLGTVRPGEAGLHVGRATGRVDKQGRIEMVSGNQGDRIQTQWYDPRDLVIRRSTEAAKARAGAQPPGTIPPNAYPGVPFINLPGLGPKPITSNIIAPQTAAAPQTVSDTAPTAAPSTATIEGTTLRPGASRTDPGGALDARTLDSSPGTSVDVNGTGKVTIDVKNDPRFTTTKDEPLAKNVSISRQAQMTPASPTGGEANMEE